MSAIQYPGGHGGGYAAAPQQHGHGPHVLADSPPLLIVSGEGRVDAVPDTVEISLGFSTRAETASAAFQQTAEAVHQVLQALLALGISAEQLQTGQVSLSAVYEKERVVGYEATATLRVTLRDPAAAGQVIDRAVAAGANVVRGLSYSLRDPGAAETQAWTRAVQEAQRKAALLAQSLGIRLGHVWRVGAEAAPGPVVPVFARAAVQEGIPVLPGTVEVSRRVQVEYLILGG